MSNIELQKFHVSLCTREKRAKKGKTLVFYPKNKTVFSCFQKPFRIITQPPKHVCTWSGVPLAYLQLLRQLGKKPTEPEPLAKESQYQRTTSLYVGWVLHVSPIRKNGDSICSRKKAKPEYIVVQNLLTLTSLFYNYVQFLFSSLPLLGKRLSIH